VRDYLVHWLTDWVRRYGVDGFRCDTVKEATINVSNVFAEGDSVRDFYTGNRLIVIDKTVSLKADPSGLVLLEKVR
jgi:1,4-alpha-glucan branching enzyme